MQNPEKIEVPGGVGGSWRASWRQDGPGCYLGRARDSLRRPVEAHLAAKMGQVGAKMALSWLTSRQDVAKLAHMGPKMGILRALLRGSGRPCLDLGGDLAKN